MGEDRGLRVRISSWRQSLLAARLTLPLIAMLVVVAVFAIANAILLWRFHTGKIPDSRAAVYGTVFSALGAFIAAFVAIFAILRTEQRADVQAHDDVRPVIEVRVRWAQQQIMFEIANEGQHPAMDFLVVVTRVYSGENAWLREWDDPRTTVLRPYLVDQRRHHYHSAGDRERIASSYPPNARPPMSDLTPMDPMQSIPPMTLFSLRLGERLVLRVVYRDVLGAWWKLEREISLGSPPYVPGLQEGTIHLLDMGERTRLASDPFPQYRQS